MKKSIAIVISFIWILLSFAPVYADTYELDPYTGEVVGSTDGSALDLSNRVRVSSSCIYDKTLEEFIYSTSVSEEGNVSSNLFNGEITTGSVTITAASDASIQIYRDGELVNGETTGQFYLEEPGRYTVRNGYLDTEIFSFIITKELTSAINSYEVPNVYVLQRLAHNGENISTLGTSHVDMTEEGTYEIHYTNVSLGIVRSLYLVLDRTAPELEITGVEGNIAKGPVTIGKWEENSTLLIYRDGKDAFLNQETYQLTTPGVYHLVYTDEAGNGVSYDFTIRTYLDVKAWAAVSLVGAILILVIAYMVHCRRHMRTY